MCVPLQQTYKSRKIKSQVFKPFLVSFLGSHYIIVSNAKDFMFSSITVGCQKKDLKVLTENEIL